MARRGRVRRSTNDNLSGRVACSRHRRLRLEPLESRRLLDAARLYVDADSPAAEPDGTAWSAAYVDLQDALDQAATLNADIDETNDISAIWIADGLYTPTKDKHNNATPDDPRTATFSMLSGVSLYGAFAGNEETLDDRAKTPEDAWLNETTLSGDLDRNDDPADETTSEENAYTVVYAFLSAPLTLDALTITAGSADGPYGADNPEWLDGAGVYASSSDIAITNSTLTGNSADDGGGIYSYYGTVTVTNSTIAGNSAGEGGGIYSYWGAFAVSNSKLTGNSATHRGGGIYIRSCTLTVTNSTIAGNLATYDGGGIYSYYGTLTVTNSTIAGNLATYDGGGIYSYYGTVTVTNSTLTGNSANSRGGGIYSDNGLLTATNSIVCLNSADDIWGRFDGSNNLLGIDPGFVRSPSAGTDGVWGTDDDDPGDLRLTDKSPAINRGDNLLAVDADGKPLITDLGGNPRIADDAVDIGTYEYQGPPGAGRETPSLVVSVTHDTFDLYDGDITLREAIYYCESGIGDGTVTFDAALDGATITLAGSELVIQHSVLIDASALSSLTVDADGHSRVFYVTDDATLRGLTITGGLAYNGGGIYSSNGILTITNSTISGNSATGYYSSGGGIYSYRSTVTVTDSTITGNSADEDGGGIYSYYGTVTVTNSTITGNSAGGGGGIGSYRGTLTVTNSTITGNSAGSGGGIYSDRATLTVTNSTIEGNSATGYNGSNGYYVYNGGGGGIYGYYSTVTVTNSSLAQNSAFRGGGVCSYDGTLAIANSTLTGNSVDGWGGGTYSRYGEVTVTDSTITENSAYHNGGGIRVLYGFLTVAGSTIAENSAGEDGGGISIEEGHRATVTNSTIAGNSADRHGGGISMDYGSLAVTNSMIAGNSAGKDGGGIYGAIIYDTVTITDSTITGNSAGNDGGGIHGAVRVTNSAIAGNSAGNDGGGICGKYAALNATNSTIAGNSAGNDGGGIYLHDSTSTVTNSTIAGNSADNDGGGIYGTGRTPRLYNTIVAENGTGEEGPDVYGSVTNTSSSNLIGDGSGMSGIADGQNGNLIGTAATVIDPRFVREPSDGGDGWGDDPDTPDVDEGANDDYGDLRLLPDSPAIDAGYNRWARGRDLAGNPRIWNGTVDMGAYEYLDTSELHPGDANFDGVTDLSDFNIFNANKLTDNTTWATGDFNGDGVTDLSDFNIWNAHKFTSAPQPAPVVSEPTVDDRLWADPAWLDELADTRVGSQGIDDVARRNVRALLATYWL